MRNLFIKRKLSIYFGFLLLALPLVSFTVAQESKPRERIIPSPQQTPIPKQSPTPGASPTPVQSPTPFPTPMPRPQQTLQELQANIRRILQNPDLQRGQVGVKIVSLDTNKTIFEENAEKYFMPASNMKSFTVAAALDRLTPDFRFVTSVYAGQQPDAMGIIRGALTIYGRGDPTFAASLNGGDYFRAINALADKIVSAGVKRIEGDLVADESYFTGDTLGATWEWDDLQWYFGTGISALTVNDNAVDVSVKPGASPGASCLVQVLPLNPLIKVVNSCSTSAAGTKRELEVTKRLGANFLEIRGTMPVNDTKGFASAVAIEKPAEMFVFLLKNALQQKGVVITGKISVIDAKELINSTVSTIPPRVEITKLESPPFSFIAAKTLKPSQNLYTELILRALGERVGDKSDPKKTSVARGLEVVDKFMTEAGIAPDSVVQWDGSGLSRHNLITPDAAVALYSYMSKHRYAGSWQSALTIGGVDGTLQNRFKNTLAAGNVRGKTGTIDQVSALSGYVTTASGEKLVFSILTNNLPDASVRLATIDSIVLLLANFNQSTVNSQQ